MGSNLKKYEEKDLAAGAKEFERFWLRPKSSANKEAVLRMRINKSWGGWKLKDGLVESLGLTVGDTINTAVTVLGGPGLIEEADNTDLFACGKGADWLLENEATKGSVIVAKVRFDYSQAPVGGLDGRTVWKASLIFVEGYEMEKKGTRIASKNDRCDSPSGGDEFEEFKKRILGEL